MLYSQFGSVMGPSTQPVGLRVSSLPHTWPTSQSWPEHSGFGSLELQLPQPLMTIPTILSLSQERMPGMGAKPACHPGSSCLFWLTCVLGKETKQYCPRTRVGWGVPGEHLPVSSKLGLRRARLSHMEDPGLLPSGSTSQQGEGGSHSRLCSLAFAKVVQRRHGPRGTSGPLLRKEGWRAGCFCYPLSGVPEPSKHNTPPSSPATLAWPLPFGIPALLALSSGPSSCPLLHPFPALLPWGGPGFRPLGCGSAVIALAVAGWGPQPSAAHHKPLAPNWQLEAVGWVE